MIILLDTDILVDVALDRAPYAEHGALLLDAVEHRPGSAFIAWHTISNFYYLLAPRRGRSGTRAFLVDLSRFVEVARTTTDSLRYAARLEMKDFEAAMQVAAADACRADVIATRNVRDYAKSPIRAARPESLVGELA